MKQTGFIAILVLLLTGQACTEPRRNDKAVQKAAEPEQIATIFPKGRQVPTAYFTGMAYNYGMLAPDSVNNTLVGNVYFEPGSRSNWHTHPAGQILIVTGGVGYHQLDGEEIEIIKKGDVVWCPPNVRHWHGASEVTAMEQLYVVPNTEKGIVEWMEKVTDEEYSAEHVDKQ